MSQILDERLAVIVKHVPALQENGVTFIEIDGIKLHLRGMPQVESAGAPELPPGRDPVTYGLPPGTKMPKLGGR